MEQNPWIIQLTQNPAAKARLLCFAYAGAGAFIFRTWKQFIPSDIELIGIQLPGRETRFKEPRIHDFNTLLSEVMPALTPYLDKPLILFGYSLGAMIAYELALKFQEQSLATVEHLIIAASRPPSHIAQDPSFKDGSLYKEATLRKMHEYQGTASVVMDSPEMLDIFIPIMQADFALLASYQPTQGILLNCPVSVLFGEQEAENTLEKALQWKALTTGIFKHYMIPGRHFFIHESPESMKEVMLKVINFDKNE